MADKTCKTCIENDNGLCDRKGILVKDSGVCEKHISGYNWAELILGSMGWSEGATLVVDLKVKEQ